jgi:hypothetical protein
MARISSGKISDTVRCAALAPAEARKNTTDHATVSVVAESMPCANMMPVTTSSAPEPR